MEPNDTVLTATQTGIDANQFGTFSFSGTIGDNPTIGATQDVDLYQLELSAGTGITFGIDAANIDPLFDSVLRVFDSTGNELAVNNGQGSSIGFLAPVDGTYYVGVSSFSNSEYDPTSAGTGSGSGSTGNYDLDITTLNVESLGFEGAAQLLKDINPGSSYGSPNSSNASNFTELDGKLFFTANDGTSGNELWVSDGTEDGTQLLKDINPGSSYGSYAYNFTEFNGTLFFVANDGTSGRELWVSDGTEDGTQLLKDINPGSSYGYPYSSNASNFTEFDGKLFFTANDGTSGNELWVSDGTEDGTQLLKDINLGSSSSYGGSFASNFTKLDGKLFFTANDGTSGRELWVSDGTEDGTQLLKDINPGSSYGYPNGSNAFNFTTFDGKLFFTANDGTSGNELWVSNGTENGTQFLKDINPGSSNGYPNGSYPSNFTEFDGKLFFTANDGTSGNELWVSDGTENGTQFLKDINPGSSNGYPNGSYPSNFTEFDGKLFFTADDGTSGNELWVSDGTEDGTQLLKDINPSNQGYGYISELTVAGNLLFFTATDGFTGQELWVSNGTSEGTLLYQDIQPGLDSSNPRELTVIGDQLFFSADGDTGREPLVTTIPDNLVVGDKKNNVLNGTAETDLISGLSGNDVIRGRGNDDTLDGASGNDVVFGDRGNDHISGGTGNDQLFGDQGNDGLRGGAGNDILKGGAGNDELQGAAGDDVVEGGVGNDTIIGSDFQGIDTFDGGRGTDLLRLTPMDNRDLTLSLERGEVSDERTGEQFFTNFEQFMTGNGNDRLLGDNSATLLNGGDGNDEIQGGAGRDTLIGEDGDDTLLGGRGADVLNSGIGNDVLIGDGGSDTFQFDQTLLDGVADTKTIQNFQARDVLDFADYLEAGGAVESIRVTSGVLRIDLNGEDTINLFGTSNALDSAETQI